jgi:hypothetical protein
MSTGVSIPPNPAYRNVPLPPPATSGNTVLKIVLIVIGIFVLFGVVVAGAIGFGAYRFAKSAHKDRNGNVSISTPNGTITTGTSADISEDELGTALYPGAVSGQGSMNMKTPDGSMVTAVYTSTDPSDKIVAFYREKLGDQASIVQNSDGTVLSSGEKDKDNIVITVTPEDHSSKIAIIHVTNAKSQ